MLLLFSTLGHILEYTVGHLWQHRDGPEFRPDHSGPVCRFRWRREAVLGILHRQYPQSEHAHGRPDGQLTDRQLVRYLEPNVGEGRADGGGCLHRAVDEALRASNRQAALGNHPHAVRRSSGQGRKRYVLTMSSAMTRQTGLKILNKRVLDAGLPYEITNHSFRGTGVTEYLRNGGDLEIAARIAGHESTRTTQLYKRTHEELSLDEIERIHI